MDRHFSVPQSRAALVPPLDDNRVLIEMIGQVTGQATQTVRERLLREELHTGHNVGDELRRRGIEPNIWNEALVSFYQQTDAFLFESIVWNRNPRKLATREWIGAYLCKVLPRRSRVLAYGDGPGFDSAYLAQLGFEVTYFETSELSYSFAERVYKHVGCPVHIVRDATELGAAPFDAIVCLDVLEHICEPEETVAEFAGYLRPGGKLIVSAPFFLTGKPYLTHLHSNRKRYSGRISKPYGRHGFALEDGRLFWDPLVLYKTASSPSSRNGRKLRRSLLRAVGVLYGGARFLGKPYTWMSSFMLGPDPRWATELAVQ
jgi:2-polyprenyl-3-methyl-5-hydroxy-6-metoxy-1,4-benzoquinol methylase